MKSIDNEIIKIQARLSILKSSNKDNGNIVRKLERNLRNLQNMLDIEH